LQAINQATIIKESLNQQAIQSFFNELRGGLDKERDEL